MMKAVVANNWCKPEELVLSDVAVPQPAKGQVLIEVKGCGMNFPDILLIAGKYQARPKRPFSPGAEIAGIITELGQDVEGLAIGDRVCAISMIGGYAQFCVANVDLVWKIPEKMPMETAAGLMVTYQSSWLAVVERGRAKSGENLLVHASAGGIGTAAVQIGKALGATVIATAGSQPKLELAQSIGADHVVNYTDPKWSGIVRKQMGGADVIIDPVGGQIFIESLKCANFDARMVIVGFTSGEIQQIPANMLLIKNIAAVGVHWNIYLSDYPNIIRKCTDQLFAWYTDGKIKPVISKTVSLEEASKTLVDIGNRKSTGKVVIVP